MSNPSDQPDPAAKAKPKASKLEVAARVNDILRIRLDGAQFHDCVEFARERGWSVSERQVGRYIAAADDLLVERQDRSRRRVLARHLAQRQALFARELNAADHRTALAILADEAKLRGLYPDREARTPAAATREAGGDAPAPAFTFLEAKRIAREAMREMDTMEYPEPPQEPPLDTDPPPAEHSETE